MACKKNELMWYMAICLVLFTENTLQVCDIENELYIIRHQSTGLVFDSSDPEVIRLQLYTGESSQLWKFELGDSAGLFFIHNNATGTVLDYHFDGVKTYYMVLKPKSGSLAQQWFIHGDGKIMNADLMYFMDVYYGNNVPGTPLDVWEDHGGDHQYFTLQKRV